MTEIYLHPELRGLRPAELAAGTAVMFDLLRASTTIVHALGAGARAVHVFGDVDAARAAAGPLEALLCGERECVRLPGFDFGNSPAEYTPSAVAGRHLALSTSNGTRALEACEPAGQVFVGALANRAALARAVRSAPRPLHLVLAGRDRRLGTCDLLAAGALVDALSSLQDAPTLDDGALAAGALWRTVASDREARIKLLARTAAGQHLARLGMGSDVALCAELDTHDLVPRRSAPGVLAV